MSFIVNSKWFHGYLSHRESELLLMLEPVGTFLLRFSKTKPGTFALTFKLQSSEIRHILVDTVKIDNSGQTGFKVKYTIIHYLL